jgi:hypothetical protein
MMKQIGAILPLVAGLALIPMSAHSTIIQSHCATNPYGLDGTLSEQEVSALKWLAYPQLAKDMRGRLGSPLCFDLTYDYYQIDGSDDYVAIQFDGASAIGWIRGGVVE